MLPRLEARPEPSVAMRYASPLLAVAGAFHFGPIFFVAYLIFIAFSRGLLALILSASPDGAIADTLGQPRVRRLVDIAWSGGALPIERCALSGAREPCLLPWMWPRRARHDECDRPQGDEKIRVACISSHRAPSPREAQGRIIAGQDCLTRELVLRGHQ